MKSKMRSWFQLHDAQKAQEQHWAGESCVSYVGDSEANPVAMHQAAPLGNQQVAHTVHQERDRPHWASTLLHTRPLTPRQRSQGPEAAQIPDQKAVQTDQPRHVRRLQTRRKGGILLEDSPASLCTLVYSPFERPRQWLGLPSAPFLRVGTLLSTTTMPLDLLRTRLTPRNKLSVITALWTFCPR